MVRATVFLGDQNFNNPNMELNEMSQVMEKFRLYSWTAYSTHNVH